MKKIIGLLFLIIGFFILTHVVMNSVGHWFVDASPKTQSAMLDGVDVVKINASAQNVNLIPVDQGKLSARLKGDGQLTVDRNGDEVEVTVDRGWWNWFTHNKLDVYIPEDYNQNMVIDFDFGNLDFAGQGMNLRELKVDMSAGHASLSDLTVDRFIEDSSAGRMDIRGLTAQHARFDVSAGDVELSRFTGGLDVDLSAGRFYAGIDQLENDITVDMSAGDVELDLPRQADFQLAAHVSAGQLTNEFDSEHEDRRYGTYGAGTYSVKLDVSAGNAHIY